MKKIIQVLSLSFFSWIFCFKEFYNNTLKKKKVLGRDFDFQWFKWITKYSFLILDSKERFFYYNFWFWLIELYSLMIIWDFFFRYFSVAPFCWLFFFCWPFFWSKFNHFIKPNWYNKGKNAPPWYPKSHWSQKRTQPGPFILLLGYFFFFLPPSVNLFFFKNRLDSLEVKLKICFNSSRTWVKYHWRSQNFRKKSRTSNYWTWLDLKFERLNPKKCSFTNLFWSLVFWFSSLLVCFSFLFFFFLKNYVCGEAITIWCGFTFYFSFPFFTFILFYFPINEWNVKLKWNEMNNRYFGSRRTRNLSKFL